MQNDLISQGVSLMLLGMGVVFVFLTLLVFATSLMSKLMGNYFPEALPQTPSDSPAAGPEPDPRLLQAIKLAIAEHRSKTRRR